MHLSIVRSFYYWTSLLIYIPGFFFNSPIEVWSKIVIRHPPCIIILYLSSTNTEISSACPETGLHQWARWHLGASIFMERDRKWINMYNMSGGEKWSKTEQDRGWQCVQGPGGADVIKWSGKASQGLRGSKGHKPCDYLEEHASRRDIWGRRNHQSKGLELNQAGNSKGTWGCSEHSKSERRREMRREGRQGLTNPGEASELHPNETGNYLIQTPSLLCSFNLCSTRCLLFHSN